MRVYAYLSRFRYINAYSEFCKEEAWIHSYSITYT